ncbi:MAG: glyoxalase [Acidobacteriota bacterium]|nr:glyoxalase [Acidobacteriota bacterium]
MPTFHHVNLGVLPGQADDEGRFLVDVLGYRKVPDEELPEGVEVLWYRADDGTEVHLSDDPEHRAAKRAHVAVVVGEMLAAIRDRLAATAVEYRSFDREGFPPIVTCRDPAGNLWELRG